VKDVDTNILVYAFHADFEQHAKAKAALAQLASQSEPWGIPSPCIYEFLATVTRRQSLSRPATISEALGFISTLTETYGCFVLDESARHLGPRARILMASGVAGANMHDARIAAICSDHGVQGS